jgi:ribonuclease III
MNSLLPINQWLGEALGHMPANLQLFERALTHGSYAAKVGEGDDYQRLEFLGDRVLALVAAAWLYERFPDELEGKLSSRLNVLVARPTCAAIGREIGVVPYLRLGKQARDDGAADSDNVLGDVVEALIGALYLEGGLAVAAAFIRRAWADLLDRQQNAPKHPKSALQEWAAANRAKPPVYSVTERHGPQHAPRFTVNVVIPKQAEASGEGSSKHEAETAAAAALLAKLDD